MCKYCFSFLRKKKQKNGFEPTALMGSLVKAFLSPARLYCWCERIKSNTCKMGLQITGYVHVKNFYAMKPKKKKTHKNFITSKK